MQMSIEELCRREVINIETAGRVGFVSDLDINTDNGEIIALIVRPAGGFFKNPPPVKVFFKDIIKIGEETILVSKVCPMPPPGGGRRLAGFLGK